MLSDAPISTRTTPAAVEIGWVLAGSLTPAEIAAVQLGRARLEGWLRQWLPEFDWRMPVVQRRELLVPAPAEPMSLVDAAVLERDAGHWDFAFIVTGVPLRSYHKPFMLGAPSQAADVAVLSVARLAPDPSPGEAARESWEETTALRVASLAMHLFGHLNDLDHSAEPNDFMFDLTSESDLDGMRMLSQTDQARLQRHLREVADPRMEERGEARSRLGFYVKAAWVTRREIGSGIRRIAPWQFPFRFSRLTTAAASSLMVLLMTAEAWEVGMTQPLWRVLSLSGMALLGTSYYLLWRQHLLSRLGHRLSEQSVITTVSVSLGVLTGMGVTYGLLFALTWLMAHGLFETEIVQNWVPSARAIAEGHYVSLAGFVASVGIVIGALGASFEQESYFRHTAMLDEET